MLLLMLMCGLLLRGLRGLLLMRGMLLLRGMLRSLLRGLWALLLMRGLLSGASSGGACSSTPNMGRLPLTWNGR